MGWTETIENMAKPGTAKALLRYDRCSVDTRQITRRPGIVSHPPVDLDLLDLDPNGCLCSVLLSLRKLHSTS